MSPHNTGDRPGILFLLVSAVIAAVLTAGMAVALHASFLPAALRF